MSTQIQRRRGTTAEHSTFTGVEGELTIDTTKDTAVVHDGTTVGGHPLQKQYPAIGSASTPTYTFTGDPNTGVYSPGADQVAISTSGAQRLVVDASGLLSVGTSTAATGSTALAGRFATSTGTGAVINVQKSNDGTSAANIHLLKSRGTAASPTVASNGDTVGSVTALVYEGSSFATCASVDFTADGAVASTDAPGRITFSTRPAGAGGANTERLRITSAGLVGVGTSSPGARLDVNGTVRLSGGEDVQLEWINNGQNWRLNNSTAGRLYLYDVTNAKFPFGVDANTPNDTLTLKSSGRVGIGTSSPGKALTIQQPDGTSALRIQSSVTGETYDIYRSNVDGILQFNGNQSTGFNGFNFSTTPSGGSLTSRLFIATGGNVGIGTTSAGANLDLAGTTSRIRWDVNNAYTLQTHGNAAFSAFASSIQNAADYQFQIAGSEKAKLDSSGRLLVGTSSARDKFFNTTWAPTFQVENAGAGARGISIVNNDSGDNTPVLNFGKANGTSIGSTTLVGTGNGFGLIAFQGSDGTEMVPGAYISAAADGTPAANSMPGRLVFSTTADGASSPTERMRLNNTGVLSVYGNGDAIFARSGAAAGTASACLTAMHSATSTTTGTTSLRIYTNGNVENTNNSYGAFSDAKLKENIVDANSQWDDLKALQVRKYNFKEGQTHTQIGLIAQEVELVSPGLVSESPDRDAEGNDLGTTTKSVNYSVLYMKAVKALQEAMERIETLEAKVAALGA